LQSNSGPSLGRELTETHKRSVSFSPYNDGGRPLNQCWELVSARHENSDFVLLDDDVLRSFLPAFRGDESFQDLSRQIDLRAPDRPRKGPVEGPLISRPNALTHHGPESAIIRDLIHILIDKWAWEEVQESEMRVGTLISMDRREAEALLHHNHLPFSLLRDSSTPAWMRIDVHQYFFGLDGVRFANIQGHLCNDTYFHVNVRVGVEFGLERICDAFRASLAHATSGLLDISTSHKPPKGYGGPQSNTSSDILSNAWVKHAITAQVTIQMLAQ